MDESEDNKNRRKTPFERVNHSTNFEDYACTSDDTKLLFTSDSVANNEKSDKTSTSKQMCETNKEPFSQSINKISNKSPKFESSVTPIISTYLADQRDHSFMESCISAGNSSAEVTPSGTPQNSPYTLRKVIDGNKVKTAKNDKNSSLYVNPKRWFYTGFFLNPDNVQHKPIINDKPSNQITKNPSFKNLSVSNFDINAVGPTSW